MVMVTVVSGSCVAVRAEEVAWATAGWGSGSSVGEGVGVGSDMVVRVDKGMAVRVGSGLRAGIRVGVCMGIGVSVDDNGGIGVLIGGDAVSDISDGVASFTSPQATGPRISATTSISTSGMVNFCILF